MIPIDGQHGDAFRAWVGRIIGGSVTVSKPAAVHLVEIDHWFDQKWLEFSGKAFGALGVWRASVTVPPFHPNRVRAERHYRAVGDSDYVLVPDGPRLHREQTSSQNLQRRISLLAPDAACYWYSGDGATVGRGALMGYVPVGQELSTWYVGAKLDGSRWSPVTLVGTTSVELAALEESGKLDAG